MDLAEFAGAQRRNLHAQAGTVCVFPAAHVLWVGPSERSRLRQRERDLGVQAKRRQRQQLEHAQFLSWRWEREHHLYARCQSGDDGELSIRPIWEHHFTEWFAGEREHVSVLVERIPRQLGPLHLRLPLLRPESAAVAQSGSDWCRRRD